MKRILIFSFILIAFAAQCFATEINWFDMRRPIGYSANPVGKMTVAYSTWKDMDTSSANFFDDHFVYFYMPLALADLRVEMTSFKGGDSVYEVGTQFNLLFAGLHLAYQSWQSGGTTYNAIIAEALFDNMLFCWGLGAYLPQDSSTSWYFAKLGKVINLGVVEVDGRLIYTFSSSGSNNETEYGVKVKTAALPVYLGLSRWEISGTTGNTIVDIGAVFNL